MSRSRILPSLSSSRQMMMAWKVSGLSQSPAIIVSRPASMRLAMAISPSRDSSSTEPISRRYMRTGSSVRSVGSACVVSATARAGCSTSSPPVRLVLVLGGGFLVSSPRFLVLDDVDAHVGEHRHGVLDLLGGHLLRRQHRVQLVNGDIAALLGGLDHLLDGVIGKVEERAVGASTAAASPSAFPRSFFAILPLQTGAARAPAQSPSVDGEPPWRLADRRQSADTD